MSQNVLTGIAISIIGAAGLALLAYRIRQPLILGYILAGAVLGPHFGFGVIQDEESIELISEIGLIFLLFIIGLEISVPRLLQAGRTITLIGVLQFPICAGFAWLVLGGVTADTGDTFDRLYLAVALSLSSTLIVVKLLSDKFELGTLGGRITLGTLIFQDLWAIAFLAMQPNLGRMEAAPLLRSFTVGVVLVGASAALSRFVLPRIFLAIARSPELMLLSSIAWCFLLSIAAGASGLSKEMGALIAGMVIAAFPYGTEVVSRLSGIRDFFVTLFFVALGLKIPEPSTRLLLLAALVAVFIVVSRFIAVLPLSMLLGLDTRTAGVIAINLGQISEFSLVIATLGSGYGHLSNDVVLLILYALLVTAVLSTYGILFNHVLASGIARALAFLGVPRWRRAGAAPAGTGAAARAEPAHDIFLLGVSREGLAFLQHLERERPEMKKRIVAVDFNPETLALLQADGVECHYGDVANPESLRHAGIERASLVVSTISDWFLQGTDNLRLLRQVRGLVPAAQVVVTADTLAAAQRLYAEGADYVLIPPALAAEHLHRLLAIGSREILAEARERQATELFRRAPGGKAAAGESP
jgi:Kef-type K+ transport system membrane component KefB